MTKQNQVYRCNVCGNTVEVLYSGIGHLVCCNKKMELLNEKTKDEGKEKHVPVFMKTAKGIKVKVGSILHPMENNHYIVFIEVIADGKSCKQFLKPGQKPETEFNIKSKKIIVREYCNVHGLWKK